MYRPERISHQKSVAVSEGFGCGKFEFARPFTSQRFQPAKFANQASSAPREGAGKFKHKGL